MATFRTIKAPGVEVNEIDISNYSQNYDFSNTTMVMLNGFTDKGDDYATGIMFSLKDFTDKFGVPTNDAERYLYAAVKETIRGGGVPVISKIPYDNNALEHYTYTKYTIGKTVNKLNSQKIENVLSNSAFSSIRKSVFLSNYTQTIDVSECPMVERFWEYIDNAGNFSSRGSDISKKSIELFRTRDFYANLTSLYNNQTTSTDETSKQILSILHENVGKQLSDFEIAYTSQLTLDDISTFVEYNNQLSGATKITNLSDFMVSAKYCELAKERSLTSYVEIANTQTDYSNYMDFDTFDDLTIGNYQSLNEGDVAIVDISKTKYKKDTRLENLEENKVCLGEYIGLLPVLVSPANAMFAQKIITQSRANFKNSYNLIGSIMPIERNTTSTASENRTELSTKINNNPDLVVFSQNLWSDDPEENTVGMFASSVFPAIERANIDTLDSTYLKQIGLVIFRMYSDPHDFDRIKFVPEESYVGSLDRTAKDPVSGKSIFLENIVNETSPTVRVFIKADFKNLRSYYEVSKASTYVIGNQQVCPLGFYEEDNEKIIDCDGLLKSLDVIFTHLENPNMLKLDLLADAGISNIAQNIKSTSLDGRGYYDVESGFNYKIVGSQSLYYWQKVLDKYTNFCQHTRKDLMYIADSPRNMALQGNNKIIGRRTNIRKSVKKDVLCNMKYISGQNTSYGAGYATWLLTIDDTSHGYIWLPPSIKALQAYLTADREYNFWSAPAGLTRGRLQNTYDVAFNPTEQDAELLYTNRWNYCVSYPVDGIVIEGQKTFQKEATAFDRVNVRRLFLQIEKSIKRMARSRLYEQFSYNVTQNFTDEISRYLTSIKIHGGLVDYFIVCNETNNTTETIERNELHCTIGIKPTKTIEFIVLNFICTNQSADVEEVATRMA